jgi:hypothetical protein
MGSGQAAGLLIGDCQLEIDDWRLLIEDCRLGIGD